MRNRISYNIDKMNLVFVFYFSTRRINMRAADFGKKNKTKQKTVKQEKDHTIRFSHLLFPRISLTHLGKMLLKLN